MHSTLLNEHDANQGAQSAGEFLGMTGNSGWYLLGSGGATILMVIFLWGVLGVSLLFCLFCGVVLCLGSVAYVFTLKNNKPEHYDADFFESALVESGVLAMNFGPRDRRLANPFADGGDATPLLAPARKVFSESRSVSNRASRRSGDSRAKPVVSEPDAETAKPVRIKSEAVVTRGDYDRLQAKLTKTEELLEDALAEAVEN